MDMIQLFSFLTGLIIFLSVIQLIRKGHLKERYAILWLCSSLVLCLFSLSRQALEFISFSIGIHYPPSLLFLLSGIFLLIINISFSVTISGLSTKVDILTQEVALLKNEMEAVGRQEDT